jgi:hypothetical protein
MPMVPQPQLPPQAPEPGAEPCPRCGTIDKPTLLPGTGPHAIKAVCAPCGRHLRWVSLLAPAERMARKMKARMAAMQQLAPSAAQLKLLKDLGDTGPAPADMAAASARIEKLKGA